MTTHQIDPNNWIDLYSDYLFNYTITRVNDRELTKDLVQETFYAGLKSMKNFKGESTERTWLISILKRKIIDYYRRKNSKKGQAEVRMTYVDNEMEGDWLEEQIEDFKNQNIEEKLENIELGDAIYDCIDNLSPRHSRIFKMKTILDYETEAICNEFGITASNLWVIIHRARTALIECLETKGYHIK